MSATARRIQPPRSSKRMWPTDTSAGKTDLPLIDEEETEIIEEGSTYEDVVDSDSENEKHTKKRSKPTRKDVDSDSENEKQVKKRSKPTRKNVDSDVEDDKQIKKRTKQTRKIAETEVERERPNKRKADALSNDENTTSKRSKIVDEKNVEELTVLGHGDDEPKEQLTPKHARLKLAQVKHAHSLPSRDKNQPSTSSKEFFVVPANDQVNNV